VTLISVFPAFNTQNSSQITTLLWTSTQLTQSLSILAVTVKLQKAEKLESNRLAKSHY
jgi:hypothetical protein